MVGEELRVEQPIAAEPQPRDEMHQRDLRGIARAMEHALAEERRAEAHAVEAADQRVAVIDLDGVAMPDVEQPAIELADRRVDPGARALRAGLRAAVDHGFEVAVAHDLDSDVLRTVRASRRRHMEAVERNDAALFRLDPEQRRVVGILRHREDAARIGLEQNLGREFQNRAVATAPSRNRIPICCAAHSTISRARPREMEPDPPVTD